MPLTVSFLRAIYQIFSRVSEENQVLMCSCKCIEKCVSVVHYLLGLTWVSPWTWKMRNNCKETFLTCVFLRFYNLFLPIWNFTCRPIKVLIFFYRRLSLTQARPPKIHWPGDCNDNGNISYRGKCILFCFEVLSPDNINQNIRCSPIVSHRLCQKSVHRRGNQRTCFPLMWMC